MKIFVALFAALVMFGAMGAGSVLAAPDDAPAFADTADNCTDAAATGGCLIANAPHGAPVGQNLLDCNFPGRDGLPGGPGCVNNGASGPDPITQAQAVFGITKNPNCPLYWK